MSPRIETTRGAFPIPSHVNVRTEGGSRWAIDMPFYFDDGDALKIVLEQSDGGFRLTDEGHTAMHLSYVMDVKTIEQGQRATIVERALAVAGATWDDGEITAPTSPEWWPESLFAFAQALVRVADVQLLTRERVRSMFLEDLRRALRDLLHEREIVDSWHDPRHDPEGKYVADSFVAPNGKPGLVVFGVHSNEKAMASTICLQKYREWSLPHRSVVVFEDQTDLSVRNVAWLTDACDRPFSSLAVARDRLERYAAS